jgi:hypothetical protein
VTYYNVGNGNGNRIPFTILIITKVVTVQDMDMDKHMDKDEVKRCPTILIMPFQICPESISLPPVTFTTCSKLYLPMI